MLITACPNCRQAAKLLFCFLFFYLNLHLVKIDFIYVQNDCLLLTFSGHHIQPQLKFCQKLTNFSLAPCQVPSIHLAQADFCAEQVPF